MCSCRGGYRRGGGGLMPSLPSPSQLLRDLDSCNSDPVAVASCFVERVRRTGSLSCVSRIKNSQCKMALECWGSLSKAVGWMGHPRQTDAKLAL